MSKKVLVVAPHPDDEVLGCGGVMARHAAAGDEVHVAVVTRGHPDVFSADSVDRVRNEAKDAHSILGVRSVRYLEFPAPRLDTIPRHQIADAVAGMIRELGPEIIYVPHHGDMHFEHGMTYEACLVAARPGRQPVVRRILAYETPSETDWSPPVSGSAFQPTVYIDIESQLEKKLRAMACFASQLQPSPHPRSLINLEAVARCRGAAAGLHAAEAFMLVREIVS